MYFMKFMVTMTIQVILHTFITKHNLIFTNINCKNITILVSITLNRIQQDLIHFLINLKM